MYQAILLFNHLPAGLKLLNRNRFKIVVKQNLLRAGYEIEILIFSFSFGTVIIIETRY